MKLAETKVEQANQIRAERKVGNVPFQVGEAHALDFLDDTFDVAYSHAVFGWFPDPVRGLSEMRRVTRKGGWVVCTLPEEGARLMYPPCPTFEKVLAVRRKHWTDPSDPNHYYDGNLGRRAVELLKKADLENIHIEQQWGGISYASGTPLNIEYDLVWLNYHGQWQSLYNKLYSLGVLEEETVIAAQTELKNWANDPYAFGISAMGVTAAGQA